jgi:cell cycle arrest protein BUB3
LISSYTFEEGEKDHPKDEVVIHVVLEHECKPKAKV